MKKGMVRISIVVALVIFSCVACAKSAADLPAKQAAEDQMSSSEKTESSGEIKSGEIITSEEPASAWTQQSASGTNSGVTVISKSENVYTDAQKQQTLKELTGEIDKLIESINNLEEAQDSELTFDQ